MSWNSEYPTMSSLNDESPKRWKSFYLTIVLILLLAPWIMRWVRSALDAYASYVTWVTG